MLYAPVYENQRLLANKYDESGVKIFVSIRGMVRNLLTSGDKKLNNASPQVYMLNIT